MSIDECFERALRSQVPEALLRALALRLISQGHDQAAIIERFEETRKELRRANREIDEDALMDVLDCLVGWCSPSMKWLDDQAAYDRGR
jgi:hypothetical protein